MGGEAYIDRRLVALAAVAGCVDAASFLGLQSVFTANQTGNTVLLGIGLSQGDWSAALRSVGALAGFCVGVALAALVLRGSAAGWQRTAAAVVGAEAIALGALAALWAPAPTIVLIALAALAMGAQSALTLQLGVPGVTTTFITGTVTRIVSELAGRPRAFGEGTAGLSWVAYLTGAVVGGLIVRGWDGQVAMAVAAVASAAVALSAWRGAARRSRRRR
jgi:uncharacterized membrane protein YoaK (UPF0700 family)